jgi:hypothetical protein
VGGSSAQVVDGTGCNVFRHVGLAVVKIGLDGEESSNVKEEVTQGREGALEPDRVMGSNGIIVSIEQARWEEIVGPSPFWLRSPALSMERERERERETEREYLGCSHGK